MGLGRRGERVANTPCGRLLSLGGVATRSKSWERSNSQMTKRWEKPSISFSPGSNSGRILSAPSASCLAPNPLGISLVFLKGLLTNPIGCGVNMRDLASSFILRQDEALSLFGLRIPVRDGSGGNEDESNSLLHWWWCA